MTGEPTEPNSKGRALLDAIDRSDPAAGEVAVWWLGQSGYVVKGGGTVVYIDPYLSEHLTAKYADSDKPHVRMTASPLRSSDITHADLVISTHRHSDHMDPGTVPGLLAASPHASYVIPRAHRDHVLHWGVRKERLVLADADAPLHLAEVDLTPVPAAHDDFDVVEGVGYPYMGFVLRMNGVALYHSGDTIPYPGLVERLRPKRLDAAFLPINGRDLRRQELGTPGNCTVEEALCLARLVESRVLVPHHYDMFTFNTVDIAAFRKRAADLYPTQDVLVMECGREYRLSADLPPATP